MQITKTVQLTHDFTEPLGLLSDCHRRVERFLGVIAALATGASGRSLDQDERRALYKALRYFQQAAPLHTQDEELSLFPRMRATGSPEVRDALRKLDALEHEHRTVEPMHALVDEIGFRWLSEGFLDGADYRKLAETSLALQAAYAAHIEMEDDVIYPLAGRALDEAALRAVGREMADRRGIPAEAPAGFSRCAARREARKRVAVAPGNPK